jgi:tetratricopeptide (TPR) repeat protein
MESLQRANDVFASYAPGGREHIAVHALRAECQQRLGLYDDAVATIEELSNIDATSPLPNYQEDLILAKAKACWFAGKFDESLSLCESIISTYNDLEETFPTTNLHMASAMTGKALSQLSAMETLDDAYSVRDFFRVAMQFLQRHPPQANSLPVAAVHSNAGIAEAVYNIFIEQTNGVSMPITSVLKTWFKGVQKIKGGSDVQPTPQLVAASKMLEATIQANLAWGVLKYEDDRSDRLSKASEYAKKALAVYDPTESDSDGSGNNGCNLLLVQKEGLPRVLSVVASCYKEAESVVTAEGLFQSASDTKNVVHPSTLTKLQIKDALIAYSDLCHDWEKREADSKRLLAKAEEIDNSLPQSWKGKSGLLGSAWFWTPGEMA